MGTKLLYFDEDKSDQLTAEGMILSSGIDSTGPYVIFDQTIFYPQGGGQPYDIGSIEAEKLIIPVLAVRWEGEEVKHYLDREEAFLIGKKAKQIIDPERRRINARYHTAGHLLAHVVESLSPHWKAVKGHHYPENGTVEFVCSEESASLVDLDRINREISGFISKDLPITAKLVQPTELGQMSPSPVNTPMNGRVLRVVQIGNFPYQPCGGTHIKHLREIGEAAVTKQKLKGNTLKVSYLVKS